MSIKNIHPLEISAVIRASMPNGRETETTKRLIAGLPREWRNLASGIASGDREATSRLSTMAADFEKRGGAPFHGFTSGTIDMDA